MPDPTTDPIRAACEAAARAIAYDSQGEDYIESLARTIARHLRGPLTDRERAAVEALETCYQLVCDWVPVCDELDRATAAYRNVRRLYDTP